ncbi:hypothetical protein pb186bvf_019714 [Paramecium bursaria]
MFLKPLEETNYEFPSIPDDHFQLKDPKTIKELEIIIENNKNDSFRLKLKNQQQNQKFQTKWDLLDRIYDEIIPSKKLDQPDVIDKSEVNVHIPFCNYDYYDLTNVDYDHKQSTQEAYQLIKQLERCNIQVEKQPKKTTIQNLTKQMQLLSFQEQEED